MRCGCGHILKQNLNLTEQQGQVKGSDDTFYIQRGTRQGDAFSTVVFNLVLKQILIPLVSQRGSKGFGVPGTSKMINVICYADDVVLIAKSQKQLEEMYADLSSRGRLFGLSIHEGKTKCLDHAAKYVGTHTFQRDGQNYMVKYVAEVKYLGPPFWDYIN